MRLRHMLWTASIIGVLLTASLFLDSASRFFGMSAPSQPNVSPPTVTQSTASPATTTSTTATPTAAPTPAVTQTPPTVVIQPPITPPAPSTRDQHWKAQTLLIEGSVAHSEAVRIIERWNEEIEPLRSNASGDVVAANQDLLEKLAYVFDRKRLSSSELEVIGRKLESLTKLLEAAAAKPKPEVLSVNVMADIGDIHSQAKTARRNWDDSLNDARAVVLKARLDASQEERSTLQQKLEEIEADKVVAALDEEMKNPPKVNQVPTNAGVLPITPTPVRPPPVDPELRAKALSPEVKAALAPFMKPRTVQPRQSINRYVFDRVFDKTPMSYGRLVQCGALEESIDGLRALAVIGCGGDDDRLDQPTWSRSLRYATEGWSEAQHASVRKAQTMLREYGPILVQEGLLSP